MRKDVGVDGDAQRIGQLVWILFLKIWDDREQELMFIEDDYVSPLADVTWIDARGNMGTAADLRWGAWASDAEGITGDELLEFANDRLFPALKGPRSGLALHDPPAEALKSGVPSSSPSSTMPTST